MKVIAFIVCAALAALFLIATGDLPDWGSAESPANSYLSSSYLQHALKETKTPNVVTAVLADYRGFDTLLETTVILIAGFAVLLLMTSVTGEPCAQAKQIASEFDIFSALDCKQHISLVVRITSQLLIPFCVVFALYVLTHGHYSPGGGFQAGVILGAVFILYSFSNGISTARQVFTKKMQIACAIIGVLVYSGVGVACSLLGGTFLDYSALSVVTGLDPAYSRSMAILLVECGVTLTVMAVMFLIYNSLVGDIQQKTSA